MAAPKSALGSDGLLALAKFTSQPLWQFGVVWLFGGGLVFIGWVKGLIFAKMLLFVLQTEQLFSALHLKPHNQPSGLV